MSEKDPVAELKDLLFAWTFADVARAVEPTWRRWQAKSSHAAGPEAFEALPGMLRKRVAKLKVVDSAVLVLELGYRVKSHTRRRLRPDAMQ